MFRWPVFIGTTHVGQPLFVKSFADFAWRFCVASRRERWHEAVQRLPVVAGFSLKPTRVMCLLPHDQEQRFAQQANAQA